MSATNSSGANFPQDEPGFPDEPGFSDERNFENAPDLPDEPGFMEEQLFSERPSGPSDLSGRSDYSSHRVYPREMPMAAAAGTGTSQGRQWQLGT